MLECVRLEMKGDRTMTDNMLTVRNKHTYPSEIRTIVGVLIASEDLISDGYGYYCGDTPESVRRTLTEISREILVALKGKER